MAKWHVSLLSIAFAVSSRCYEFFDLKIAMHIRDNELSQAKKTLQAERMGCCTVHAPPGRPKTFGGGGQGFF